MEWSFPLFFNKVCPIQLLESARPFYTENNLIWSLYILEEGPGLNRRAADWRLHDGCSFNRTSTTAKAEKKRALFTALQLAALLLYIVLESLNYGRWMLRICCTLFCMVLCWWWVIACPAMCHYWCCITHLNLTSTSPPPFHHTHTSTSGTL